jgi:tetratricopeptide (TPR) repeat protein
LKAIESLKRGVSKARRLWSEGRVDRALSEVERLLKVWPNNPHLLVMRAELIQLQDDVDGTPTLEDAKSDLELAAGLDEDSPEALIELGYFLFVNDDDAKEALKRFDKAVYLCVDLFTQALVGHAEALAELGQETKALSSLMMACSLVGRYPGSVRESVLQRIKGLMMESTLEAGSASSNGSQQ